ncbi:hypothetical protein [Kitasatospora azatica]|nr:hypothetical protein [Kitasatospora azatica]
MSRSSNSEPASPPTKPRRVQHERSKALTVRAAEATQAAVP